MEYKELQTPNVLVTITTTNLGGRVFRRFAACVHSEPMNFSLNEK